MNSGIDSSIECRKHVDKIAAEDVAFVGRYYRNNSSSWPKLTSSEAKVLSAAGLQVVALWESASDHSSYFTYTSGMNDGTTAYAEAVQVGEPANTPIYFAVDFDASDDEACNCVNDYFLGVAAGYQAISRGAPAYGIGVYESGATCL